LDRDQLNDLHLLAGGSRVSNLLTAEAALTRLEVAKQTAVQTFEDVKQRKKQLNVQLVIAALGCIAILPIPYFLFLLAFKLPKLAKDYKAADVSLRQIEKDISAKRIEIADLRITSASA
jgi:hypothetical protein